MSRRLLQQFVWYGKKNSPIINSETLEIFTKNPEKNQPSIIYIYICRIFIVFFFGNIQLFLKFLLLKPFPPPLLPSIILIK